MHDSMSLAAFSTTFKYRFFFFFPECLPSSQISLCIFAGGLFLTGWLGGFLFFKFWKWSHHFLLSSSDGFSQCHAFPWKWGCKLARPHLGPLIWENLENSCVVEVLDGLGCD
eukprot:TRINITY_DN39828_c0_g3_i1.p1 TRINITY_DN39828_c0_g3~~TRINITY_DN39828_c0_g3_i1.p1  ORF type:complete len:112 (-),score=17.95 TRINITY_DN39828_c0_g3_i1:914-1249(-)